MAAGLADMVAHRLLKAEHPFGAEVACAGDGVALVGVLAAQLEGDEVAAVVEHPAVDEVVLGLLPAGRMDLANIAAFLGGQRLGPQAGEGLAAASEVVERDVGLKCVGGRVVGGEAGLVAVEDDVKLTGLAVQVGVYTAPLLLSSATGEMVY